MMDVYVLLDRTGSMLHLMDEAITAVNTYVEELRNEKGKINFTVAIFDDWSDYLKETGGLQFNIIRDYVAKSKWKPIDRDEARPRGMTPLLDATAKVINMAKERNTERTAIVVMTDGMENASTEYSFAQVAELIKECEERKWPVTFLGADFNTADQSSRMGVAAQMTMNVAPQHLSAAMSATSVIHRSYMAQGTYSGYDELMRREAGEDEVS